MSRFNVLIFSLVAVLSISLGCKVPSPEAPTSEVFRPRSLWATDAGEIRLSVFDRSPPSIGQCVDDSGLPGPGECVPATAPTKKDQERGRFRYDSVLKSLETDASVQGGASKAKVNFFVATHEVVMEWSRSELVSLQAPLAKAQTAYVSGIESGIAVRVVLTVKQRNASAEATVSFGFGQLAAAVVAGKAEVGVRYDTIGVKRDILPQDAPTNVTSINDLLRVQNAFYEAVRGISRSWNCQFEAKEPCAPQFTPAVVAFYVVPSSKAIEDAKSEQRTLLDLLQRQQQQQQQQQQQRQQQQY